MTGEIHSDVEDIARRASVVAPRTVLIDGVTHRRLNLEPAGDVVHPRLRTFDHDAGTMASDTSWLASLLYDSCYVRVAPPLKAGEGMPETQTFRLSLSRANRGSGGWDTSWSYETTENAHHAARWRNVQFAISQGALRPNASTLAPGSSCAVRVPKERQHLHPGFYFVLGDEPWAMGR
jgi:hypothetical protein